MSEGGPQAARCLAKKPFGGPRCALYAGHEGDHSPVPPPDAPWAKPPSSIPTEPRGVCFIVCEAGNHGWRAVYGDGVPIVCPACGHANAPMDAEGDE